MEEIAHDIVNLYAQRAVQEGISFDEDSIWQSQMEDSFMYEPTGDQKRAVEEIKRDMILAKPMERLLCGDVGFGKTEVAIRAAFNGSFVWISSCRACSDHFIMRTIIQCF